MRAAERWNSWEREMMKWASQCGSRAVSGCTTDVIWLMVAYFLSLWFNLRLPLFLSLPPLYILLSPFLSIPLRRYRVALRKSLNKIRQLLQHRLMNAHPQSTAIQLEIVSHNHHHIAKPSLWSDDCKPGSPETRSMSEVTMEDSKDTEESKGITLDQVCPCGTIC